jgi:hypothetical protein
MKMDTIIHRNCACIQLAFSAYRTQLTGKLNGPFKRALNFTVETELRSYIYLYLYMISALEGHGNTHEPVRIYACRTYI